VARGIVRSLSRVGAVSLAAFAALGMAGCTGKAAIPATTTPGTVPATAAVGSAPSDAAAPSPSAAPASSAPVLADGRHAAYLTSLNVGKKTIGFDKVDFLTGAAAKKAYLEQNPGETDGPPNDYLIVNDNPLVRTLPIADAATITIVDMTGDGVSSKKTTLAALPAYFASDKGGKRLWHNPFWLTVKNGQIRKLEEQFLP
jgi:hypothetical protein